jgi:putative spermidine/putrescine transport system substrate-binding protein
MPRREFIRQALALGVSTSLLPSLLSACGAPNEEAAEVDPTEAAPAAAQPEEESELIVASWGGSFGEAQRRVQFDPFTAETEIEVVLAAQQPELALLEAQVTSGNVEWDLAELSNIQAFTAGAAGWLQPIDYSKMDPEIAAGINEAVKAEHSVGIFYIGRVMGYNTDHYADRAHPANWAEFWDGEAFSGRRGVFAMNWDPPPLEIALLAQGVPPDQLYPLDIDAAFASLDELRPHVTKWIEIGVDVTQLLAQGELDVATAAVGNTVNAIRDGAPVAIEWNQGLAYYDAWVIPKGAPHPENALRFIEFCMRPEVQAEFSVAYPGGAVVPKAFDEVPAEVAEVSVGAPQNLENMIVVNADWWTKKNDEGKTNLQIVFDRWAEWILE